MRRSALSFTALAALSALLAVHCGTADDVGSNEADHTAGEYVHENAVYAWAEPDYEAFEAIKPNQKRRLADDHPVVVRVQTWLDRYDAIVRERVKTDGKRGKKELLAPKPKAIVYADDTINAWVSWFPACIGDIGTAASFAPADAGIDEDGGDAGTSSTQASSLLRLDRKEVARFGTYPSCLAPKNWPAPGKALATWWNQSKPACTLTAQKGGGFAVGGEGCSTEPLADTIRPGVMWSTGSGIHATTSIISKLSEKAFAVVIAHELGHYYRAHGSSAYKGKYEFWYERDAHEAVRPLPAADSQALGEQVKRLSSSQSLPAIPGQKVSPRTAAWFVDYSFGVALRALPGCADADAALSGGWTSTLRYGGAPTEAVRSAYLAFEEKLFACAAGAPVGAERARFLASLGSRFPGANEGSFAWGGTLQDLIDSADKVARTFDEEEAAVRERLNKNRIGWYTTEQEADDLAMELSTLAGLTPKEVLDAWVEAITLFEGDYPASYRSDGSLDLATCKALYANDFTTTKEDGTREQAYVPIGSLSGLHHSNCYRLFNLWRESIAHEYVPAAPPEELSPAWAEIQEAAKRDGSGGLEQ